MTWGSQSLNTHTIADLVAGVFHEPPRFLISHDSREARTQHVRPGFAVSRSGRRTELVLAAPLVRAEGTRRMVRFVQVRRPVLRQGRRGEASMPGVRPGAIFSAGGTAGSRV